MKKTILAAALVAGVFTAGAAIAKDAPAWTEYRGQPIANSHHLNKNVVALKLLEMGYENFAGYEVDHGLWKVIADKDNERLAVWVNPNFGNVVKEETSK